MLVAQLCLTLCNPMDCSPPGSPAHGILRQEYWSGLPFPSPGNLPLPRNQTWVSCIAGRFFIIWTTREALCKQVHLWFPLKAWLRKRRRFQDWQSPRLYIFSVGTLAYLRTQWRRDSLKKKSRFAYLLKDLFSRHFFKTLTRGTGRKRWTWSAA